MLIRRYRVSTFTVVLILALSVLTSLGVTSTVNMLTRLMGSSVSLFDFF